MIVLAEEERLQNVSRVFTRYERQIIRRYRITLLNSKSMSFALSNIGAADPCSPGSGDIAEASLRWRLHLLHQIPATSGQSQGGLAGDFSVRRRDPNMDNPDTYVVFGRLFLAQFLLTDTSKSDNCDLGG